MPALAPIQPLHPLPEIEIGIDLAVMAQDLEQAIMKMPDAPLVFQRAHRLVGIARGVKPPPWLFRHPDAPSITEAKPAYLRQLASQAATCVKLKKDRKGQTIPVAVLPPTWLIETLQAQMDWRFPALEGISCAPVLCPNGEIITDPGYHQETGLYLDFNGTIYPDLPSRRTKDEARRALYAIAEAFVDFPFVEPCHYSAALAMVLSVFAKYAIRGKSPGFAAEANTPGTGKGLLIDAISTVATGLPAPCWTQTTDPEEERKRLLAIALAGDQMVHIDNVTEPLGSGPLNSAMTAGVVAGRLLGGNEREQVPIDVIFCFSGNNIVYTDDISRRLIPIQFDAGVERPEERSGFAHDPLIDWVRYHRPRLVASALTVLACYMDAKGQIPTMSPLGSFEGWSNLVRAALVWLDEADPCEGRKVIQAQNNPDVENLHTLLDAWYACYGTDPKALKQVSHDIQLYTQGNGMSLYNDLRDALAAYDPKWDGKRINMQTIGFALRSRAGRRIGDKRMVRHTPQFGGQSTGEWKVEVFT
jgi:putative DNA primase/helicase